MLEETHLDTEHNKMGRGLGGASVFCILSKGVAILISFAIQREVKDKQGRFIEIIGTIGGTNLTIMNIYASNEHDPNFFFFKYHPYWQGKQKG